mgnify:CR=1 FL=1
MNRAELVADDNKTSFEIGETAKEQDKRLVNYAIVINEELRKDKVATMKKEEGEWKIVEITGGITDLKAKIAFDEHGEKILLLKYAKIRVIELSND